VSAPLDRTFAAVVLDWYGTAVPHRRAGTTRLRQLVESLCRYGVEVIILSRADVHDVDAQLGARPTGPGALYLCPDRGSEVYRVTSTGPVLVPRRLPAPEEVTDPGDPPGSQTAGQVGAGDPHLAGTAVAGRPAVAGLARQEAVAAGLPDPKVTTCPGHVGLGVTDAGDSIRWVVDHLDCRGVGPGLVLVAGCEFGELGDVAGAEALLRIPGTERCVWASVGPEPNGVPDGVVHLGGGPATVRALLAEQLDRHRGGAVPYLDEDPRWLVGASTPPTPRRVCQTLLTLSDGQVGTRGSLEEEGPSSGAAVLSAGVYEGAGAGQHLLEGPLWTVVGGADTIPPSGPVRQTLDLRTGVLVRHRDHGEGGLRSLRFSSAARAGVTALRAEGPTAARPGPPLRLPAARQGVAGRQDDVQWASVPADAGAVTAAAAQRRWTTTGRVERVAAYDSQPTAGPPAAPLSGRLRDARRTGFPALLAEHRAVWAARWADARIDLPDDPAAELALRFASFHLLATVSAAGEAAVGARGLTGPGYSGHVFWDADVFVLPMLAAVRPAAARAMLEYRVRRLDAARALARSEGLRGARFPWESARNGTDVTPRSALLGSQETPVRTGDLELHIVADVAWSAWRYAEWSGDEAFLRGPGRPLIVDTARYWASRARLDGAGRAHIDDVIGPDEYHVGVDDDAFTNVMARWNLRRAADLVHLDGDATQLDEAQGWRLLADALVDGYDPCTRRHEQFAGFDRLEPLLIAQSAQTPVAADILLGTDRVSSAQVVKQTDVLMLHHLVPDELPDGSLEGDLQYYGPRTAHGSSLSPAVNAAVLARAGHTEEALRWFRIAAAMDLEDLSGMSGSGLHLATMGGLWQALVQGFLGIVPTASGLRVEPRLPPQWACLGVRLRYRGRRVGVQVTGDTALVEADRKIRVVLSDGSSQEASRITLRRGEAGWALR
jgi:trehalose/maltose hydrolase-like predicted phosphorylase